MHALTRRRLESVSLVCSCGGSALWSPDSAARGAACPACGTRTSAAELRRIVPPRPVLEPRQVWALGLATTLLIGASVGGLWMQTKDLDGFVVDIGRTISDFERCAINPVTLTIVYCLLLVGNLAMLALARQGASRRGVLPPWMVRGLLTFLVVTVVVQTVASLTCDHILGKLLGILR